MYWGRLGSRPWYRISAGTCSTSSSPWSQEETRKPHPRSCHQHHGARTHGQDTPNSCPKPLCPRETPPQQSKPLSPARNPGRTKCPQLPGQDLHAMPLPHSLRRAASAGTPPPCAPAPRQWTCTCAAGTGQGHQGPPCCHHPVPSLPDPCARAGPCRCAGWDLLSSGLGQAQ